MSADHLAALRAALPLVLLAEREDPDAFALALADLVDGPEDAGAVVFGLVELVRFTLGAPPVPPDARVELLEGLVVDAAAATHEAGT